MAVALRLQRHGSHKRPFYRVVVTDDRRARNSRFIEQLGTFDPSHDPSVVDLKLDRVDYWVGVGAQPSDTVRTLIKRVRENATQTSTDAVAARRADRESRRAKALDVSAVELSAPPAPAPAPAPEPAASPDESV